MKRRFEEKVVIVTGASSGIGKATAIEFAREGAKVVVAARRAEQCEQTVKLIKDEGGEAIFIQTDVAKHSSIQALVAKTIEAYGRLDCAFNNAGVAGDAFLPTAEHTEENWDQVMNINLKGVWLCMKYQIPEMLKRESGAIVNNSSVAGLRATTIGTVPYVASKHGVIGLTKPQPSSTRDKGFVLMRYVRGLRIRKWLTLILMRSQAKLRSCLMMSRWDESQMR